ncbi:PREDICTED: transmembrane protein 256 homolog [Dufourea novaeangliae]|uniref:transmembrane protein 256 homolog n=1 Tax=Dufourea novaeangliae TaxID=178035 RepID=UPI0007675DD9|nr:PREDICTED: transmembrane protein 256 homolog [Dufourea novaeangliae]
MYCYRNKCRKELFYIIKSGCRNVKMSYSISYVELFSPVASAASYFWNTAGSVTTNLIRGSPKVEIRMAPPIPLWKLASATGPYVRLAALSGAAAVALGAYGSHRKYPQEQDPENKLLDHKQIFEIANRYHFIHTLAVLGLPLCRAPFLGAMFLMSGMVLFSGSCYYYAFTGDKKFSKLTPIGGVCLILGWLSMCI